MTIEELKQYFINAYQFGIRTGISGNSFRNWVKWGYIPMDAQCRIERFTSGELKANFDHARSISDR